MLCFFLKKYRRSDPDKWIFALVSEWVLMADSPSHAVDLAEQQLAIVGFEMPDKDYAVLFDSHGDMMWDRGP
ncbi:MAG: hypothetical protein ISR49_21565 [Alphaproteobacteria bacterium]|nr:hypothetical protein [Alphaproteobacteria bacterium]